MEMTEFRMVQGWLLPAGANVEPTPVLVPQHYTKIAEVIGARLVDAVYNDVASIDGYRTTIVGFVDDEGLFDESKQPNVLATVLFDRDQVLVGDCVVFDTLNEFGVSDGDNYDVPSWLVELGDELVVESANLWNKIVVSLGRMALAVKEGVLYEEEMIQALSSEDEDLVMAAVVDLLGVSFGYASMRFKDYLNGTDESIGDAVERLVEGQ